MPSDAIDAALVSYLAGDGPLSALLTGGVHDFLTWGIDLGSLTPPYAVVSLFSGKDVREFRRRGWEECRFLITIIGDSEGDPPTPASTYRQAMARIDQLLEGGTFAISGYTLLKSERERRFVGFYQFDEIDELDSFIFGSPIGGLYVIWAQAN